MPWVVGIDEAGYGPNLGPLAQAAVAVRLPDHDPAGWDTLRPIVRRAAERRDDRILIDDSKLVHEGKTGLAKLERGVLSCLGSHPRTVREFLREVALAACADDIGGECWFDPAATLPLHPDLIADLRPHLAALDVALGIVSVNLVVPKLFNQVVAGSGSKATVLASGLVTLLRTATDGLPPGESVLVYCDKQGGRNVYAHLLQATFPDGWVATERESAEESRYRIDGLNREVRVLFRPRADSGSVSVAIASMLAKYLREVCMRQFNAFWLRHVPDLKPTAGYPQDAKRFYVAIRDAMTKLGIAEECVWRCR